LTKLEKEKIRQELLDCQKAILMGASYHAKLFRPPYGSINAKTTDILGMSMVKWTLDPKDWKCRNAKLVAEKVIREAVDGSIVILHDTHKTTVEAVRIIIPKLKEMGFELVTVSELL